MSMSYKKNFHNKRRFILLFLTIILCSFFVVNIHWLWVYRHGGPLDIDEAGYLGISLTDYFGFLRHGLTGFFWAVEAPGIQAPLTTALTGLALLITGPHIFTGFVVMTLFGMATISATYFLGENVGGSIVGLVAALLVAASPPIVMYSRSFIFALPLTFNTIMALLSLIRSNRFTNTFWSLIFGIFCGFMPLSRTMAIAFLPGLIFGAAVYLLADKSALKRKIFNFIFAIIVGAIIALIWFWPNGRYVFNYLMSYGYGNHASEYGRYKSILGVLDWIRILKSFSSSVYLFDFTILGLGGAALFVIIFRFYYKSGFIPAARMIFLSRITPLVIFVMFAVAALASSQNKGNGFTVPIVPVAMVIAIWSLLRLCNHIPYRVGIFIFIAVAVMTGALPALNLKSSWAISRSMWLPVLGKTPITDGRGYIQIYESGGGFASTDPNQPIPIAEGKKWMIFNSHVTEKLLELGAEHTVTAFGFRHRIFNINTVRLQELLTIGRATDLTMVDPITTGDSLKGDVKWLKFGAAAHACLLLTSDAQTGEIAPVVSNQRMIQAANQTGFKSTSNMQMPNGEFLTIWKRQLHGHHC